MGNEKSTITIHRISEIESYRARIEKFKHIFINNMFCQRNDWDRLTLHLLGVDGVVDITNFLVRDAYNMYRGESKTRWRPPSSD